MGRTNLRRIWILAAAIGFGACGPDEGPIVERLPGGGTRVENPESGVWGETPRWTLSEVARFGGYDAPSPELQFGSIVGFEVDNRGRVILLDRAAREVRVFHETGPVRTVGGEGAGPGEFLNPFGIDLDPRGRLWVADAQTGRYTVFDSAGVQVSTVPRELAGWGMPWGGGFGADGELYEPSYDSDPSRGESRAFIRYDVQGGLRATDSIPLPFHIPEFYRVELPDNYRLFRVPFTPRLRWVFDGSGGFWFGLTDTYRLIHRTFRGDTLMIVERSFDPDPVRSGDIEEALEALDLPEGLRPGIDRSRIPSTKPVFSTFSVDRLGYLWVFRADAGGSSVVGDIFDPGGIFLGTLALELSLFPPPVITAERVYAIVSDDLGAQQLVIYRLSRSAG
ncbi:MAG: hypothetical protein MJB57_12650 [Gemmatimonadetes bacterium]|nr:hypothetical protein [Gemmatimonadota bacterium]